MVAQDEVGGVGGTRAGAGAREVDGERRAHADARVVEGEALRRRGRGAHGLERGVHEERGFTIAEPALSRPSTVRRRRTSVSEIVSIACAAAACFIRALSFRVKACV